MHFWHNYCLYNKGDKHTSISVGDRIAFLSLVLLTKIGGFDK